MQSSWVSKIAIVVQVGGLLLTGSGYGVTPAAAAPPIKEDAIAGVTQNWDKVLPSAQRFTVLPAFNNEAVRDNETGLVWERAPASSPLSWLGQNGARGSCAEKSVGGRKGWRLPAIIELSSLIDPAVQAPGPTLQAGHPFTGIQSSFYWSASTFVDLADNAWGVNFHNGTVTPGVKAGAVPVWCVRGGMNADAY